MVVTTAVRPHPGWLIAAAAFLGQFAAALGFLSIPLFAPSLAAMTGLDERDFAFSGTFVFLAVGLSSPYTGALIRRLGAVRMMATMLACMAVGFCVILAGTWTTTMMAGFLFGIAYGMYGPASSTVVATRTPASHRGLYMSIRQSGVPFAGAVAGRVLPPLILAFGFAAGVATISGAMLVGAAMTLAFGSLFAIAPEDVGTPSVADDGPARTIVQRFFDGYRLPMPLQAFAFTAVGFAICHLALASFAYFYLLEELGYSEIAAGAFISNVLIAATLGRPVMGLFVDATGSPVRVLAGIALLGALAFGALLTLTPDTSWVVVALVSVAAGVSANTWTPVFMTAISNAAPTGRVGDYNGRAFSYAALGWTLAAPVVWTMIELSGGYTLPFTVLIGVEIAMATALFIMAPRVERG